jgi:hypothetical protein
MTTNRCICLVLPRYSAQSNEIPQLPLMPPPQERVFLQPRLGVMKFMAVALTISLLWADTGATELGGDLARLQAAEKRWLDLGANTYTYDLGVSVGAVFGWGQYRVKVKNGKCSARHYGGVGFGRPTLLDRLLYRRDCKGLLPSELFAEMAGDLSRGYHLTTLEVHPQYGFPISASTDTDRMEDQGWGFEIKDFAVKKSQSDDT